MEERRARLRINLAQREFEVEGSESFVAAYAERLDRLLARLTEPFGAAPGTQATVGPDTDGLSAAETFGELLQRLGLLGGLTMGTGSHVVDRAVETNPVEPGREVRSRFEASELPIRAHEGFLNHVFGVLGPAGHPVGQPEDVPAVPLDEDAKSLLVAAPRPGDRGRIVRGHLLR